MAKNKRANTTTSTSMKSSPSPRSIALRRFILGQDGRASRANNKAQAECKTVRTNLAALKPSKTSCCGKSNPRLLLREDENPVLQ